MPGGEILNRVIFALQNDQTLNHGFPRASLADPGSQTERVPWWYWARCSAAAR